MLDLDFILAFIAGEVLANERKKSKVPRQTYPIQTKGAKITKNSRKKGKKVLLSGTRRGKITLLAFGAVWLVAVGYLLYLLYRLRNPT